MLMELAEVRLYFSFNLGSAKACLTIVWQSSKVPAISRAVIFWPIVVSCFSCRGLTLPFG